MEALCDNEDITALSFVGSTRVAKLVYGRPAQTGKRVLCLGGAKNHLIVVPDADLELTAQNVMKIFTGCAGQRCMADPCWSLSETFHTSLVKFANKPVPYDWAMIWVHYQCIIGGQTLDTLTEQKLLALQSWLMVVVK